MEEQVEKLEEAKLKSRVESKDPGLWCSVNLCDELKGCPSFVSSELGKSQN